MADYYTNFSVFLPLGSAANVEAVLDAYSAMQDEIASGVDSEGDLLALDEMMFELDEGTIDGVPGLIVRDGGESGDVEQVMDFMGRVAAVTDLSGLWTFSWANTCSKPRLDGFGGDSITFDLSTGREVPEAASALPNPYLVNTVDSDGDAQAWVFAGESLALRAQAALQHSGRYVSVKVQFGPVLGEADFAEWLSSYELRDAGGEDDDQDDGESDERDLAAEHGREQEALTGR